MSDVIALNAEPRERPGKGGARAVRRSGFVPAIVYGAKIEPRMISVESAALIQAMKRPGFLNHVFEIAIGGATERVLPREVQRDPVTDQPLHVDFLRIAKGAKVTVEVAVAFVNEDKSPGLKKGGVLNVVMREIEVECAPDAIPDTLAVDLAGLDIGDVVHIGAVPLPAGVTLADADPEGTVASIASPSTGESAAPAEAEDETTEGAA